MRSNLPARAAISAVALAAAGFQGYNLYLMATFDGPQTTASILVASAWAALLVCAGMGAAALCLALLWRAQPRPDSLAFALVMAAVAYLFAMDGLSHFFRRFPDGSLLGRVWDWTIPAAALVGCAALLRFSVLFPTPLSPAALAGRGLARVQRLLLRPRAPWAIAGGIYLANVVGFLAVIGWNRAFGTTLEAGPVLVPLTIALTFAMMAAVVANLRVGHALADADGRRRLFWIVEGILVATTVLVLAGALKLVLMAGGGPRTAYAVWYPLVSFAALACMIACFAVAMFFAGALDPALAIRRTAVVGLLSVLMLFAFAGMEQLVQEYVGAWLGLSERLGGIVTGGAVGLLLEPTRGAVTRLVDRVRAPGAEAAREFNDLAIPTNAAAS